MIAVAFLYQILVSFAVGAAFLRVIAENVNDDRPDLIAATLLFCAFAILGIWLTFEAMILAI